MSQEELLSWNETVKIFIDAGWSESTLRRRVKDGIIKPILPEGRQRGSLYPKDQVLAALGNRRATGKGEIEKPTKTDIPGETDWVCESDLPYLLALDYEMYGVANTVDISITHAWWEKNPYMCRILFDKNNRKNIWGAVTVMPIEEETIIKILRDELQEKEIKPDDILTYEKEGKYWGYIPSAMIKPEHRRHFRKLLESIFAFWCQQYPRVQLIRLYAFAASDEGLDLMRHLFFSPRYDLGERAFELDLYRRNPSKLIKSFQECIKRKEDMSS